MKDVQCYEFFDGIALKNQAFSLFIVLTFTNSEKTFLIAARRPSAADRSTDCSWPGYSMS